MRSALWFLAGIITGIVLVVCGSIAYAQTHAADVPVMLTRSCVCDEWKEAP